MRTCQGTNVPGRTRPTWRVAACLLAAFGSVACWLGILVGFTLSASAQTIVCGNTSGTWTPAGNPYMIACDSTVPAGQTLTIEPGVVVWVGSNVTLTVNGLVQAVGTPTQRITIGTNSMSWRWNTFVVTGTAGTNRFKYCDFSNGINLLDFRGASQNEVMYSTFSNATTGVVYRDNSVNTTLFCSFQNMTNGIWMEVIPSDYWVQNWTQTTKILNCTFANCYSQSVHGQATGIAGRTCGSNYCYNWSQDALIACEIRNCYYYAVGAGCRFNLSGYGFTIPQQGGATGYGYGNVRLLNNVLCNVTNTAVSLSVDSYAGGGPATLVNNTMVNAGSGVVVHDPWDATVRDCIISGCTNATMRTGSLSLDVRYNDYFSNATNFSGYPATYGQIVLQNRNGTPCDLFYNIFSDPSFVAPNDFHLQTHSPCIDAGMQDWAYTDMCFPPSQGASYPDLGAYGGPDAVNWLDTIPLLRAQAAISVTNGIISVSWGAIPRSEYQVQWTPNVLTFATNWFDVTNGWVRATDKPTSVNVETNPPYAERYYRVKSLGRSPGY